ncbi:MAG: kinase/pyrophosphorylase [Gammaproteobacteria bacterium]|nr:kinase/pyrophosphorylase [Gammaproteobacteria bacterium]
MPTRTCLLRRGAHGAACGSVRAVKHCGPSVNERREYAPAVSRRTVFFVSDQTGVTAETLGHSLMTQFEGQEFRPVTLPFVSSLDKAHWAVARINQAGAESGLRPIVFSTLVQDELRDVVLTAEALFLDLFSAFVGPLERELNTRSTHRAGRAHGIADLAAYTTRINATNFALANDDGTGGDYAHADVVLVGVSRVGKTPTCVYMALQYGVFAANYPLTEDDLESSQLPKRLEAFRHKLYALTIAPERLHQIRTERRPDSRYASRAQVQYELRTAQALFARHNIPSLDTTECSIEEIASRILNTTGIERRLRP